MTPKISCLVVDDDEVDLHTIISFLEDYPYLEVTGRCDSAADGLAAAQKKAPDALFLDIDMPGMNGMELRQQLLHIPACIFITSYPDYALESFEMAALDFLVKPFSPERFAKTAVRLQDYFTIRRKAELLNHTLGADTIFIKDGTKQVKLQLHEIIYFEALNNYTSIVTTSRKYAVLSTLGNLLKEEAFGNFIRIHRSFAVQKHFIEKVGPGQVLAGNIPLPVGRNYKDSLNSLKP
ncbi:MAG TPA: LytTR family DNA-binding domain-containing protein [Puia sp.]|nr:LytTR family DNA-binding domain-containing protein [Puia sp.]